MKHKIYSEHSISKELLKSYASHQNEVFILDSCSVQDAMNLGKYEILLAIGSAAQYRVEHNSIEVDWEQVNQFCDGKKWCFAVLGYDLKNNIDRLESQNPNTLSWPNLFLNVPELVITINKQDELCIWADNPEQIYQNLLKTTINKPKAFEVDFKEILASIDKKEYVKKVQTIKDEIGFGNVYEMNLCIEYLLTDFKLNHYFDLFEALIERSPTPFSAFVKFDNMHILSASPERFIHRKGKILHSQPIKGTTPRYADDACNKVSREYLRNSEKERAEHIMIVDLVRNDLSKCSISGTTKVEELFGIYSFAQVNQMISTIESCQLNGISFDEIIKNTFPMGSMTGAPKHIAMQYIDRLEMRSRGWYSGSVGYVQPNGNFDFNVVIRSLLIDSDKQLATFSVGGAITYDSDPEAEYQECQLKASAIKSLLLNEFK